MTADTVPALKEIFNKQRIQHIADETERVSQAFDRQLFLASCGDINQLSLMARVTRVAESLHAALPKDFRSNVETLRKLAPRLNSGFVTLVLPEYVAHYGADDFDLSMEALKFFTTFGSSEFAVRHFLRRDLPRTLKVIEAWAHDENEHVRRLASEGCRPRLPWSFHIKSLRLDPSPLRPILDALKDDPSLYVRRSVANNLNDITKDNPYWALDHIESWLPGNAGTRWIAKHALRTLIKKGDPRALAVIGAGNAPLVELTDFCVSPPAIRLGQTIEFEFVISSTTNKTQRLVVDYAVHYVKKSGSAAPKVFKLKILEIAGNSVEVVRKRQSITNFTTRVHYPGHHAIEILINGQVYGRTSFDLLHSY